MAVRFGPKVLAAAAAVMVGMAAVGAGPRRVQAEGTAAPTFLLPWRHGQPWLTGVAGFHGAFDALDFFPPDTPLSLDVVCEGEPGWYLAASSYPVLASAPGAVSYAQRPLVVIDHGGGWSSSYFHLDDIAVRPGQTVAAGEELGRPSTYGGCTTGAHLHFWVQGPGGLTTSAATLSGLAAAAIGTNVYIDATGNPPPAAPPAPGDADCDGDADPVDALAVLREVAGMPHSAGCVASADADCSGTIEATDALAILRFAAGLTPALGECPRSGAGGS